MKKLSTLFLLLGVAPAALGANLTGFFSEPVCAREINGAFRTELRALERNFQTGMLTFWEKEELARRSSHTLYLVRQTLLAQDEFTFVMTLTSQRYFQDSIETSPSAARPDLGTEFQEMAFSKSILRYAFPNTPIRKALFLELMIAKTALTEYRENVSLAFTDLVPASVVLTHAEVAQLEAANARAIMHTRKKYDEFYHELVARRPGDVDRHFKSLETDKRDYRAMARELMQDLLIPFPVRQEISRHMDFESKYAFEPTLYCKWFLLTAFRFFRD